MAKLMFIHHSGLIGGAGVSLINTIKRVAEGNEIIVCVPSEPEDMYHILKEFECDYGIKIIKYCRRIGAITYYSGGDNVVSPRLWYRIFLIIFQWKYWNQLIEKYDPDKVVLNSKILCWMSMLKSVKCRKSICFVRETMKGKRTSVLNSMIAAFLDKFAIVVFLSDYDAKREGLKRAGVKVVHDFVERTQFHKTVKKKEARKKLGLSENGFYVLYVGGVSYMKGFDLCVEAVLRLNENVKLIVAGNTFDEVKKFKNKTVLNYATTWEKNIKENDLKSQICMVGKQKDMSLCYSACDVLVFPMRSPHQSRPAFEAGYFGKPVIISDFENIDEFIKDGENGFKVPHESVVCLCERINILYQDEVLCEKMGMANKLNAEKMHDDETNCKKIKHILEE